MPTSTFLPNLLLFICLHDPARDRRAPRSTQNRGGTPSPSRARHSPVEKRRSSSSTIATAQQTSPIRPSHHQSEVHLGSDLRVQTPPGSRSRKRSRRPRPPTPLPCPPYINGTAATTKHSILAPPLA